MNTELIHMLPVELYWLGAEGECWRHFIAPSLTHLERNSFQFGTDETGGATEYESSEGPAGWCICDILFCKRVGLQWDIALASKEPPLFSTIIEGRRRSRSNMVPVLLPVMKSFFCWVFFFFPRGPLQQHPYFKHNSSPEADWLCRDGCDCSHASSSWPRRILQPSRQRQIETATWLVCEGRGQRGNFNARSTFSFSDEFLSSSSPSAVKAKPLRSGSSRKNVVVFFLI